MRVYKNRSSVVYKEPRAKPLGDGTNGFFEKTSNSPFTDEAMPDDK